MGERHGGRRRTESWRVMRLRGITVGILMKNWHGRVATSGIEVEFSPHQTAIKAGANEDSGAAGVARSATM